MQTNHFLQLGALALLLLCVMQCSAIKCHQCNSYTDEACADPFRIPMNESNSIVDCAAAGVKDGVNYTFCRKTVQTASLNPDKSTVRVIRDCGFLDEPKLALEEGDDPNELKCYRRVGTYAVEFLFCACYADGCNAATANVAGMGITLLLFIASTLSYNF